MSCTVPMAMIYGKNWIVGELDFTILLEPVEAAKYDGFRLPYWES